MKALKALSICCLMLSAMACSNEEPTEESLAAFQVVSSISPVSRAPQLQPDGSGEFMKGDVNTLFFHDGGQRTWSTFNYTNGASCYWADVKLPANVKECQVSASYPQVSTQTPENFEWNVLQAQPSADILLAQPTKVTAYSSSTIRLSFSHVLHHLAVELLSGDASISDDELRQATVECRQFYPVAVLNLLQGKAVSATGDWAAVTEQGKTTGFMIPAQPAGAIEVAVRMAGREGVFRLAESQLNGSALQQLESGKTLKLKVKVNKSSFTIVGQSIAGWGSQGEFEDSIII